MNQSLFKFIVLMDRIILKNVIKKS